MLSGNVVPVVTYTGKLFLLPASLPPLSSMIQSFSLVTDAVMAVSVLPGAVGGVMGVPLFVLLLEGVTTVTLFVFWGTVFLLQLVKARMRMLKRKMLFVFTTEIVWLLESNKAPPFRSALRDMVVYFLILCQN